jgi:hypothetical protein
MALSSSRGKGCVVIGPLSAGHCATRGFGRPSGQAQAASFGPAEACRNIGSNRQRALASLRVPRVSAIRLRTSMPVRWLRSASPPRCSSFLGGFSGCGLLHHFVGELRETHRKIRSLQPSPAGLPRVHPCASFHHYACAAGVKPSWLNMVKRS